MFFFICSTCLCSEFTSFRIFQLLGVDLSDLLGFIACKKNPGALKCSGSPGRLRTSQKQISALGMNFLVYGDFSALKNPKTKNK